MIDPTSAAGAAGALAEITGSMSGMSMAQAYEQNMTGTYDPYDPTQDGITIGYGNYTTKTPAISGDTEGTVEDSVQSDPEQAWLDWMHNGGSVDSTTGGAVLGSSSTTINYSLMKDQNGNPQAVQPIAIERDTAIVAISQALGVSMKISEVDPVFANKMAQAIITAGVVYDKARDLFMCWWDGVNILFPKKAVDSLNQVFEDEGVGPSTEQEASSDQVSNVPCSNAVVSTYYNSYYNADYTYTYSISNGSMCVNYRSGPNDFRFIVASAVRGIIGTVHTVAVRRSDGVVITDETQNITTETGYAHNGQTVYYRFLTQNGMPDIASLGRDPGAQEAWAIIYGSITGGGGTFPEGTQESIAPSYTPSDLLTAGAIAGKNKLGDYEYTPVTPISLPEDPTDTAASTENPTGSTNPDRTTENEREAPIPLPIPDTNVSNPDVPLVDSSVVNSTLIDELVEELANTLDPQPEQSSGIIPFPFMPGTPVDPDDPSQGSSYPSIVPASGSGLIHVYNPTPGEFVGFGNWLWVTYADATIDKIWNNPFDGIIGAHELYATPQTDGRDNIRSGFLVCPVQSDLVRQRYTEIDCGTVIVPEFYGNYFDYSPYSQAYIYLPFIGINEVSIDDIVGHAVNIRYRVDAYNGSCIAMIYVAKSGYRNLCYQFAGNCAVEVPLAGGSQAAIKAGMLQAEAYSRAAIQSAQIQKTASIGSGILNGAAGSSFAGPLAGIIGALAGGTSGYIQGSANVAAAKLQGQAMQEAARYANKSSVQHSGQFGASHGAMGLKTPFIMIRNPIQVKVVNYNNDYGFPAHKRVIIGGCTGYLRVREVNVISAHATNEEKRAIEEELKAGVYVS